MADDLKPDSLHFLVLPGDGIGPEVISQGVRLLEFVADRHDIDIHLSHDLIGGQCWDHYGTFCRDETVSTAKQSYGVLVGAVGGPQWDGLELPGTPAEKDGLMRLRQELDAYVGLRPSRAYSGLEHRTPFKPEVVSGSDILVLREMCGGSFFREPRGIRACADGSRDGFDNYLYNSAEVERFAHAAFELARNRQGRVASMDKSNVMENNILWRECVSDIGAGYPDVELTHYYADNGFYQLMMRPNSFDVVMCDNLFGDLASDIAATVSGSLGMLPSACLPGFVGGGAANGAGIYEPVHGSAPDFAGQGIANPVGTLLSVAMMLEFSAGRSDLARSIETAIGTALEQGCLPADLGGDLGTEDMTSRILEILSS